MIRRFARLILTGLVIIASFGFSPSALARNLLRTITLEEARTGSDIAVWSGSGTNIDFSQTGEVIRRVWLDDPSRITADFDGELCDGDGCGAEIIHLRRIEGVHFTNLPETPSTLLTVVTRTPDRQTHLYQFRVTYGQGSQEYATVSVAQPRTPALPHETEIQPELVQAGLGAVINEGIIPANSPVVARTQDFLARLAKGETASEAANNAQISMAVILRLSHKGQAARLLNI